MRTAVVNSVKKLFQNTFITIDYRDEAYLYIDWEGYISVAQVKEGCNLILDYVIEYNCHLILNNNQKVKGTWTQAVTWLSSHFMPKCVDVGVEKIAFLYSPVQSARYSVDRLLELNADYEGQSFDDLQEALAWLLNKNELPAIHAKHVIIKTNTGQVRIAFDDIYFISATGSVSIIQTLHNRYETRKNIGELLNLLPEAFFFRIHKSHIVNIQKVKELKYHEGGYYHLFVQDFGKIYLTVSKNHIKALKLKLLL